MIKPRDPAAVERKRVHKETIRQIMLSHTADYPLRRPLSGKEVQGELARQGIRLALSTVLLYVKEIYDEAEEEAECYLAIETF